MIYAIILFILFSFMSNRLIGIQTTFLKGFIASLLSFIFSTAAYYVFHLQNESLKSNLANFDHYTFLYFITLIVVSLGFSLLLEMMKRPIQVIHVDTGLNTVEKVKYFFSMKLRYISLLIYISKNGLLRTPFQADKKERNKQLTTSFKRTLEKSGGIFIKFGQFLSTRSDLFPKSFLDELATLQENAPPIPFEQVKEVIQKELGQPIDKLFQHFETEPIAAASIAQVHRATLHTGEVVAVKVLRPTLKKQLMTDVQILMKFSELITNRTEWAKRIGMINLTEGFIRNLYEEVDFTIELKNIEQMKQHASVYIPKAFKNYSTAEVFVMEFLEGVSVNHIDTIVRSKTSQKELMTRIFQEMMQQIFDYGIFDGDPHPGNIFLLKNGEPAFIDFGSVGKLSKAQMLGFKWLLIGMHRKNADSMMHGLHELVENNDDID